MRVNFVVTLVGCVFVTLAAAWSKEDHEIFTLRDQVAQSEGQDVTFYSFLGVSPSASHEDIEKAYRKKSRQLHPDKARQAYVASFGKSAQKDKKATGKKPGVTVRKQPSQKEIRDFTKEASARFARFNTVASVLRGSGRERYDHFLRNGFPKWRGTGYYYSRYRPGLGTVLVGLFIFAGGFVHYGAMYLGWKRQRDFVDRYIKHARRMAWGDDVGLGAIPGLSVNGAPTPPPEPAEQDDVAMPWNRREKRRQEKEARKAKPATGRAAKAAKQSGTSTPVEAPPSNGPRGAKKRVVAENGKILIVDSAGNVYLEETTEEGETHEYLLDVSHSCENTNPSLTALRVDEIAKPTIFQTFLFRLPVWGYNKTVGRLLNKPVQDLVDDDDVGADESEEAMLTAATAANPNAEMRKRREKAQ